jgi:hypothetical protein
MQFDIIVDTLRNWMEALRAWLLQQPWLSFAHDWIHTAAASTLWAIVVITMAGLILLIGFLPYGKPRTPG